MGKLYGLGVGPGDPELMTLKTYRILRSVAVVCVPNSGQGGDSQALEIARPFLLPAQQVLTVVMPMLRDQKLLRQHWRQAAEQVLAHLQGGEDVAFLTLGDPTFFSTFTYLMRAVMELDPGVLVEMVPGVTSVSAAAARLNVPLAEGKEGLAVLAGTDDMDELDRVLQRFPNVALMKVGGNSAKVVRCLEERGLTDCAAVVSRCSQPGEQVIRDVRVLREQTLDYFSLMLIRQGGRQ